VSIATIVAFKVGVSVALAAHASQGAIGTAAADERAPVFVQLAGDGNDARFNAWRKEASAKRFCIIVIAEEVSAKYGTEWEYFVLGIARAHAKEDAPLEEINAIWFEGMKKAYARQHGDETAAKIMDGLRTSKNCY
jgi:hypothetical protein